MSSSPSSASSVAAPAGRRLWRRCLRVGARTLAAVLGLLFVAWLIVHWGLLPRVAQWKPWIEARASQELGQTVQIRDIQVSTHGWIPALDMTGVQVLDRQGRPALQLGRLRATLAAHALLAFELRFAQLHVDGVQLDVRRETTGRIRVAGLDMQADQELADDGRLAEWLFSQNEIVVRQGAIRWTDEWRQAPPLDLAGVDLVLRNGLLRHQIRLDATPPAAWGQRLTLVGDFSHGLFERRGNWRTWSGTLHVALPAADVGELRQYVQLPFDLRGGRGQVRAWLDVDEGRWRGATGDVELQDVRIRLARHLEPLDVARFSGRVKATRRDDGVEIAASNLALTTGGGLDWPLGQLTLSWQQKQPVGPSEVAGPVTGGQVKADRLDLRVMTDLASRLPLGRPVEAALKRLKLSGVVQGLDLSWTGPPDEPQRWRAKGRLTGFGLPAVPSPQPGIVGRPGVSGADADFEISESGGHADLALVKGELQLPGLFEKPDVPMQELRARLEWRVQRQGRQRPAVEVKVTQAQFANADVQGDLQATWRSGPADKAWGSGGYLPGAIDLSGHVRQIEVSRIPKYLPVGIAPPVRRYIGRAVRSGWIDGGSFAVKGELSDFPFSHGQPGVFKLTGQLRDVQFDYLPHVAAGEPEPAFVSPWPGLRQVQGELTLDRDTLSLNRAQAQIWGVQFRQVQVGIEHLGAHPVVEVRADGRGPAADMLRFVDVTPVGDWLSGATRPMSATGLGELKLALDIPLHNPRQATVKGSIALNGNDLELRPDLPPLTGARGRVDFTHQGFQVVHATARALGGDLTVEGGTQPDQSLRFEAQGLATAEGLARFPEWSVLAHAAQRLRGQSPWRARIGFVKGQPDITVSTDLVGMVSDWPAPFSKAAATPFPVVWHSQPIIRDGTARQEDVQLDLASVAQLRLLRERPPVAPISAASRGADVLTERVAASQTGSADARVLGGTLGLQQPATAPRPNGLIEVQGRLGRVDAIAWQQVLERWPTGDGATPWPRWQVAADVEQLWIGQRPVNRVALRARQDTVNAGVWQVEVDARELAGTFNWRAPAQSTEAGRLTARLKHLSLPASDETVAMSATEPTATRWPTVDLQVEQFSLRGRRLGRLELRAASKGGAVTSRDWSLEQVQLDMPGALLVAEGHWSPPASAGGPGRMALHLSMNVLDSARLASNFGWSEAVRGGNGVLQGSLTWSGTPTSPDMPTLEGQLNLALNQGQFLRAGPGGLGRLLGILSLQALPRRLLLDFRDVFQQGFAFDQVTGDVQIVRGRARTDNLRMGGLQATVLIDGSADLLNETQDLRVLIVPEVNAGAASLAYAAVNPAVGLGTFLAQLILRDPFRAANTREFVVTGPMSDPRVERVERSVPAPPSAPQRAESSEAQREEIKPR